MSNCPGPECGHPSHKPSNPEGIVESLNEIDKIIAEADAEDAAAASAEETVKKNIASAIETLEATDPRQLKRPLPRNVIVRRVFSQVTGKWWFKMADGSHIKPETAVRRGLIDPKVLAAAIKEEEAELEAKLKEAKAKNV